MKTLVEKIESVEIIRYEPDSVVHQYIEAVDKVDYDRLKAAFVKLIEQRNDYATLVEDETRDTSNYRCDTDADDLELQKVLEGAE